MKRIAYPLIITMILLMVISCGKDGGSTDSSNESSGGIGGSMARFAITEDYLYVVGDNNLKIVDIIDPANPRHLTTRDIDLGQGAETIFVMDDLLFIGTQTGMSIFDITTKADPRKQSSTWHVSSCDPVVAQGNYAYVTLNSASARCGGGVNQLLIYDITDRLKPKESKVMSMHSPKGLAVKGDKLFVCDNGLVMYHLAKPDSLVTMGSLAGIRGYEDIVGYDAIVLNDQHLILTSPEGLYQIDYTGGSMKIISEMAIDNN